MPDLVVRGLGWQPAGRAAPVLPGLDLDVPTGQHVLLAGPSGSGKSTLLRALAGVLGGNESGTYAGSVTFGGADPRESGAVGLLVQDPADAVVAHLAGRDVAFGLENHGVPRSDIWPRVAEALASVRFPYGPDRPVDRLSGGERQRLALAGVVVLRPGLLLLDEPTAMLDAATAGEVRSAVLAAAADAGATTVVVEHRMGGWYADRDRLVVLGRDGTVVADGPAGTTLAEQGAALARQGVWVPGLPVPEPLPVPAALVSPSDPVDGVVEARSVSLRRGDRLALSAVSARLAPGSVLGVCGASGAGKSSLLGLLAGLQRPTAGAVVWSEALARGSDRPPYRWRARELAARVGYVPQEAEHGVVRHEVREDVLATGSALGHDPARLADRVDGLMDVLGLGGLERASPYRLSGGEQRRLSLATALAHGPDVLLLDEPTVGQDRLTWAAVTGVVAAARAAGVAVAMATHDEVAVAAVADRTLRLAGGEVVPDGCTEPAVRRA